MLYRHDGSLTVDGSATRTNNGSNKRSDGVS
jgi:hypothetical protein